MEAVPALPFMTIVALLAPVTLGVKVTLTVQDADGAMLEQFDFAAKDDACAPVMLKSEMVKVALPVLVTVMVLAVEVEPTERL